MTLGAAFGGQVGRMRALATLDRSLILELVQQLGDALRKGIASADGVSPWTCCQSTT